jgi:CHAT domain-containing protein
MLAELATAELLHFAGHGDFRGGVWDGHLLLSDEGKLSISDILALPHVPERVVLSGCETAKSRSTSVENIGLAQAFLAAGTRVAVASSRKVDDGMARSFSELLYEEGMTGVEPVSAFQQATLRLHAQDAAADVGAFRMWLP